MYTLLSTRARSLISKLCISVRDMCGIVELMSHEPAYYLCALPTHTKYWFVATMRNLKHPALVRPGSLTKLLGGPNFAL